MELKTVFVWIDQAGVEDDHRICQLVFITCLSICILSKGVFNVVIIRGVVRTTDGALQSVVGVEQLIVNL